MTQMMGVQTTSIAIAEQKVRRVLSLQIHKKFRLEKHEKHSIDCASTQAPSLCTHDLYDPSTEQTSYGVLRIPLVLGAEYANWSN